MHYVKKRLIFFKFLELFGLLLLFISSRNIFGDSLENHVDFSRLDVFTGVLRDQRGEEKWSLARENPKSNVGENARRKRDFPPIQNDANGIAQQRVKHTLLANLNRFAVGERTTRERGLLTLIAESPSAFQQETIPLNTTKAQQQIQVYNTKKNVTSTPKKSAIYELDPIQASIANGPYEDITALKLHLPSAKRPIDGVYESKIKDFFKNRQFDPQKIRQNSTKSRQNLNGIGSSHAENAPKYVNHPLMTKQHLTMTKQHFRNDSSTSAERFFALKADFPSGKSAFNVEKCPVILRKIFMNEIGKEEFVDSLGSKSAKNAMKMDKSEVNFSKQWRDTKFGDNFAHKQIEVTPASLLADDDYGKQNSYIDRDKKTIPDGKQTSGFIRSQREYSRQGAISFASPQMEQPPLFGNFGPLERSQQPNNPNSYAQNVGVSSQTLLPIFGPIQLLSEFAPQRLPPASPIAISTTTINTPAKINPPKHYLRELEALDEEYNGEFSSSKASLSASLQHDPRSRERCSDPRNCSKSDTIYEGYKNRQYEDNTLMCNSQRLAKIIKESAIPGDAEASKRIIQQRAESELGSFYNVICGTGFFSYIAHTDEFCLTPTAGDLNCYVFSPVCMLRLGVASGIAANRRRRQPQHSHSEPDSNGEKLLHEGQRKRFEFE